jgi:hypothetical protein
LLAADLCHFGFVYKEGLNVDPLPFIPAGECRRGGLYFTAFEYLTKWYKSDWPLIADVTLPDGARVYEEPCGTKWKADRLMLSNIRPLGDFLAELDEPTLWRMLKQDGMLLQHVRTQTDAMCMAAVQKNGLALEYVHKQTDEICLAAVKKHGLALMFVQEQNDESRKAAVQRCCLAMQYMKY